MTETETAVRVMIVDDQPALRTGLAVMVEAKAGLTVVGDAEDGMVAVERARELRPDVILMDVRMPRLDGIAATQAILAARTAGAVVMLTTFSDEEYLLDAIRAGASGFLLKDAGPDLIASGVRAAHAGDSLIAPSMTKALLEQRLQPDFTAQRVAPPQDPVLESLSPREKVVLSAVARGGSNSEIAAELWLSEATVKSHLSNLMVKTSTTNRVQLAALAYESGFLRPGWLESPNGTNSGGGAYGAGS